MAKTLSEGHHHFHNVEFQKYKNDFLELVKNGQAPKALFIGCSDSRVIPSLITSAKPGDLFVVQNIGNFVPPYKPDEDYHGTATAIEYAVSVLKVETIIICGHSHCGAIKALYEIPKDVNEKCLIHTKKWLELGADAKQHIVKNYKNISKNEKLRLTEKKSIIFQLENLLTYPQVTKAIQKKKLTIQGWYYSLEDGSIKSYNYQTSSFQPIL